LAPTVTTRLQPFCDPYLAQLHRTANCSFLTTW
jgi:hypothetical protein